MDNLQIDLMVRDLYFRLENIKNLTREAKYVLAYDKLKGAMAKCWEIHDSLKGHGDVANESLQDRHSDPADGNG